MIAVIADDITGAAEIAGIAKTAGKNTKLVMTDHTAPLNPPLRGEIPAGSKFFFEDNLDVLVFATDTRQMSEAEAVKVVEGICLSLTDTPETTCRRVSHTPQSPSPVRIFKKIDSVLRGHIQAECDVILRNTAYEKLLLLPQNPSKGRVVRHGLYYINDIPLDETQFAHDPEYPARTAEVGTLGVPDAETQSDIARLVAQTDDKTLFAGGADLFKAVLQAERHDSLDRLESFDRPESLEILEDSKSRNLEKPKQPTENSKRNSESLLLLVCGSTQSRSIISTPLCRRHNAVECNMPEDVFLGKAGADAWLPELNSVFPEKGAVLTINYPSQGGKAFAVRLRKTMAQVVKGCLEIPEKLKVSIDSNIPKDSNSSIGSNLSNDANLLLILEGGATAFEILSLLGWTSFNVEKEHSPGVVELSNSSARIILKPGSYPWNGLLD